MSQDPKRSTRKQEPVAIIGIGCMFPQAEDLTAYWANIRDGVDAITDTPDTHWQPEDYFDADPDTPDKTYGRRGGFLDKIQFNPMEFGISPRDVEATDTSQLLGMAAAKRALQDAGYPAEGDGFDRSRCSVILGVTGTLELVIPLGARLGHPIWRRALSDAGVDASTADDVVERMKDSYVSWQENSFPGLLGNVVAGRIANRLDLHGTNCVVDAACASSLSAVHLALLELEAGRSDMVVTGGVDTFNDIFMYMCFSKTPALSPTGDARPFAETGDGTILGEGLGIMVLKRLADAERDGDRVYAVIRGMGSASDGKGDAVYAPTAKGQARALRKAYDNAGIAPDTIELLEAHGTGTKVGDATEIRGLTGAFVDAERERPWCALGSVKSMIGHTKAAAGAAGLIKAAMALHHRVLPPTLKVDKPNEAAALGKTPFYVNTEKRPWLPHPDHPRRAGVSAFGFGGSNFHCVLEEYVKTEPAIDWDGTVQIVALAAGDRQGLGSDLRALTDRITEDNTWDTLRGEAARSRASFDAGANCRLVMVVERRSTDRLDLLRAAADLLERSADRSHWESPKGIYFAEGVAPGGVAAVFPGQGSQYPGMLRDLSCLFLSAQQSLAMANEATRDLDRLIYPHPAFDDETRELQVDQLRQTQVAQPAIGAVSLGAYRVLSEFGVRFSSAVGHSYGELTALCASGRLDESDFHRLSRLRGELMAEGDGDRGTMLAVMAGQQTVEAFLERQGLDLVVANRNAPKQVVLSGETATIEKAATLLKEEKIRCRRLSVSAAFHSRLVAEASAPFRTALEDVELGHGDMPVFANTSGEAYPEDSDEARSLLASQLTAPVEFQRAIENMRSSGASTFVEVGPGRAMTGLVDAILADDDEVVSTRIDGNNGAADLARTLATLAARGHYVELIRWDPNFLATYEERKMTKKPAFTLELNGANYTTPKPKRPPTQRVEPAAAVTVKPSVPTEAPKPVTPRDEPRTHVTPSPATFSSEALNANQEALRALVRMQEQTAELHRRFLEGQEQATRSFQELIARQQVAFGAEAQVAAPLPAPIVEPAPVLAVAEVASVVEQTPPAIDPNRATEVLLSVVADKTGYPAEMLELSMGLDADLGIDSIKRVEILSALQEQLPEAPVVKPEHLGELQTLGQIVDFLRAGTEQATPDPVVAQERPSNAADTQRIAEVILAVVADKTGYPADMLELSMGLDADLGIDSIKRVEILSSLQAELPEAPVVTPDHLGELKTLGDIVAFLGEGIEGETAAPQTMPATVPAVATADVASASPPFDRDAISAVLLGVVSDKTGYPSEMLELSMGLDADLGIDSIKRVEILAALQEQLPDAPVVMPEHLGELQTLEHIVDFLGVGDAPTIEVPQVAAVTETAVAVLPPEVEVATATATDTAPRVTRHLLALRRVSSTVEDVISPLPAEASVWVTRTTDGLSQAVLRRLRAMGVKAYEVERTTTAPPPADLAGLIVLAPLHTTESFLHEAFALTRTCGQRLRESAESTCALYATVSRLDGAFGVGDGCTKNMQILSGGLAGLSKTVGHEWPQVRSRTIDLDASETDVEWAAEELVGRILGDEPGELGIRRDGTFCLGLVHEDVPTGGKVPFEADDVVLITGGARGVTAEVGVALARAAQPRLVLFGRSPEPTVEPDWLQGLDDETSIKQAILNQTTERLSPRELNAAFVDARNNREILRNVRRMEQAGSSVTYRSVDVRDGAAMVAAVNELEETLGPVTGLIHGAGVLADSFIADKSDEDFDRVFGTKVEGLTALLEALRDRDLKGLVNFSSSTARFGRTGQADYAVANEVLNKIAVDEQRRRPGCRVVSVNWGPWDGGMVTPALREIFADEGVSVIHLEDGARYLMDELALTAGPVEVVVLGESAGAASDSEQPAIAESQSTLGALPELPTVFEREISVDSHEYLRSHVIDGMAILPAAALVEWLGHGALHGNPGLRFNGFDDLRVFKGVRLGEDDVVSLRVCADRAVKANGHFLVETELCSTDLGGRRVLHARATIVLATSLLDSPKPAPAQVLPRYRRDVGSAYEECLFHGPELQGLTSVEGCDDTGIVATCLSGPSPRHWSDHPLRSRWIADPMAIDCAFQLMVLWSHYRHSVGSLPTRVRGYRQFRADFPTEGTRIEVRVTGDDHGKAIADIDWLDAAGRLVARMSGYQCVVDASLNDAFRRNTLEVRSAAGR